MPVTTTELGTAAGGTSARTEDRPATNTMLPPVEEEAPVEFVVSEDVPDIGLLDLASGSTVSLRSVVTGDTPLLFWFWSPL